MGSNDELLLVENGDVNEIGEAKEVVGLVADGLSWAVTVFETMVDV